MDFDRQSLTSMGKSGHTFERPGSDIKRTGLLKKLKTMKKKYFVLRSTSSSGPARLEYYDSEKKFNSGHPAKRSIYLHTCFNINKKTDSRHCKLGIALYTHEECFTVLADTEEDQEAWLKLMLEYENEYMPEGDMRKEHYEYVWQVTLQAKGLAQGKGMKGQYRLCLNSTTISLVKANSSIPQCVIQLVTIRSVAHNDCSFRIEVGKYAPTGEGEFCLTLEDSNMAKDLHATLLSFMNMVKDPISTIDLQKPGSFRTRSESHSSMSPNRHRPSKPDSRPVSCCTPSPGWHSMDTQSPISSPSYPHEHFPGPHRPRSDTGDSRVSRGSSQHDDITHEFHILNGDIIDGMSLSEDRQGNVVPPDMSPPSSPNCLDEQMSAYLEMDRSKPSSSSSTPPASVLAPSYLSMTLNSNLGHAQKGELSPSMPDPGSYLPMTPSTILHASAPIPIHSHTFSESHHPLPTVTEGGSNEGYLPMDVSNSPSTSSVPRPGPAKCLLLDDNSELPPRTYSLGSKPVAKKHSGYMEMGPRKGSMGNDMSRAISAPHIIHKGRRDREPKHHTESPSASASPLSMSVKSDDSDSFMEYMSMRPRTASDSFNYRNRTNSFSKVQNCRPRSSSHGQGTRPFTKFSKLAGAEPMRLSQDPLQRTSRESSLHSSFDSLRVSNESLRRAQGDMRHSPVVGDHPDSRGSPLPTGKAGKDGEGYVNMEFAGQRMSSPLRKRTDSASSGRQAAKTGSADRNQNNQQGSDYTVMTPIASREGEAYVNMDFGSWQSGLEVKGGNPFGSPMSSQPPKPGEVPKFKVGEVEMRGGRREDNTRSVSMENVDTYVVCDRGGAAGNKPRTGSLGAKDKKASHRSGSGRKPSSTSMSSSTQPPQQETYMQMVSASTRKGGSSDSIRKPSRQSSIEKHGSLGKDFRKKSGSTGSRPLSAKGPIRSGIDHHMTTSATILPRKQIQTSKSQTDDPVDEYIMFTPAAVTEIPSKSSRHSIPSSTSSSSSNRISLPGTISLPPTTSSTADESEYLMYSPAGQTTTQEEDAYTPFAPGSISSPTPASTSKSVHFHRDSQFHQLTKPPPILTTPSTSSALPPASYPKQPSSSKAEESDYLGFKPQAQPASSASPFTLLQPNPVPSYVLSGGNQGKPSSSSKHATLKQHASSLDSSKSSRKHEWKGGPTTPTLPMSTSLTFDPQTPSSSNADPKPQQHSSSSSAMAASSPLSISTSSHLSSSKPDVVGSSNRPISSSSTAAPVEEDNEYMTYNPALTASKFSPKDLEEFPPLPRSKCLLTMDSNVSGGETKTANSTQEASKSASANVGKASQEKQKENTQEKHPRKQDKQDKKKPKEGKADRKSPQQSKRGEGGPNPSQSSLSLHPFQPSSEAPNSPAANRPVSSESPSPPSPLPKTPSESLSSGRQKHASGSSTSSQKSRRISSDSEKSWKKGGKSDSDSSLGRNRRRTPSSEKSPNTSIEKGVFSSSKGEGLDVFCGEMSATSGQVLDAKMLPVEAKIRHSMGDMTCAGTGLGMVRPGSTPCMQQLDTAAVGSGNHSSRSASDVSSSYTSLKSQSSRSRHSLTDLHAQSSMGSGATAGGSCAGLSTHSEGSNGQANSGSGDSCNSNGSNSTGEPTTPKSLIYAQLDLGNSDTPGDSPRNKSRNSSDADEKEPPVSYAQIDFVKSQSHNKSGSNSGSADSVSSSRSPSNH